MEAPVAGPAPALHRGLRRIDLVSLTVDTVVGAGVFAMPAQLAAGAGHPAGRGHDLAVDGQRWRGQRR